MKILSQMLNKEHDFSLLLGIILSSGDPSITHLLYADDVCLFGQATKHEVSTINHCLQLFLNWSGQALNPQKSVIFNTKNTNSLSAYLI